MSFLLTCPNCGPRDVQEFRYGGQILPTETPPDGPAGSNLPGPQRERWFHAAGCRRFVTLTRDTRTNIIVAQPGEPAGDVPTHA